MASLAGRGEKSDTGVAISIGRVLAVTVTLI